MSLFQIAALSLLLAVANFKLVQLSLIFKERLKALNFGKFCTNKIFKIFTELSDCRKFKVICSSFDRLNHRKFSLSTKGTTRSNKKLGIFRNNNLIILQFQSFNKALTQLIQKVKRSAQKGNMAANRLTAGKSRNCLANYSLENRSRNILTAGALINQRLNISFSKYTTAGRNRVNLLHAFCKLVQSHSISFEQSCHLVYKGTSTTGTGTIHALLYTAAEISNLGVFTTKLNYNISLRNQFFYRGSSGNNFLNKRNIQPLRNRKTTRTGYLGGNSTSRAAFNIRLQKIKSFIYNSNNRTADICTVTLIVAVN